MKKIFLSLICATLLFSVSLVSASTNFVNFNGEFNNGTTLYSDWINVEDGYVFGKDAYPIRDSSQNQREKVCEILTRTKYQRVCTENTDGYRNVTRKRCSSHGYPWSEVTCEYITYQVPTRARTICERVPYEEEYEKCKWVRTNTVTIGCQNPSGYTNQLNLENFKYTLDEVNWIQVPYYNDKVYLEDTQIKFKVEIPEICSPSYSIDKAIYIKD